MRSSLQFRSSSTLFIRTAVSSYVILTGHTTRRTSDEHGLRADEFRGYRRRAQPVESGRRRVAQRGSVATCREGDHMSNDELSALWSQQWPGCPRWQTG